MKNVRSLALGALLVVGVAAISEHRFLRHRERPRTVEPMAAIAATWASAVDTLVRAVRGRGGFGIGRDLNLTEARAPRLRRSTESISRSTVAA